MTRRLPVLLIALSSLAVPQVRLEFPSQVGYLPAYTTVLSLKNGDRLLPEPVPLRSSLQPRPALRASAAISLNQDQNQFEAFNSFGTPLSILYAGAAPGLINGVFQINVQLTTAVSNSSKITLHRSGGLASNTVQLYVK
jgi:hypothetical protein